MSRQARRFRPGTVQHFVSRFVDRRPMINDEHDRAAYLRLIDELHSRWDWIWLSYALMSTHVHHGPLAGCVPPASLFLPLHSVFARQWHTRHGGLGPVFASRPANWEVAPEAVGRLIAYQHRNPVSAGVVGAPAESRWTSHRAYLRLERAPPWLDVERGLALCGFDDRAAQRRAFDEFVREVDLRDVGRDRLLVQLAQRECAFHLGGTFPPSHALTEEQWALLRELTAHAMGIDDLEAGGSRKDVVRARRVFAVVAHRYLRQPLAEVSRQIGRSLSGTHHLIHRDRAMIETLRPQIALVVGRWNGGLVRDSPSL